MPLDIEKLRDQLERKLNADHGPLISGKDLRRVLGFKTDAAFRRTRNKGLIDIPIFDFPGRKGKFALTQDVATWMAAARARAALTDTPTTTSIPTSRKE